MTTLGTASLDLQVLTAPALASLRTFATSATSQFRAASAGAKITPSIDGAAALRDATKLARQIQDKLKVSIKLEPVKASEVLAATRSVTGTVKVKVAVTPLSQKTLDDALKAVPGEKKVRLTLDDAAISGKISGIRSQLTSLAASLTNLFKIDASALVTVSSVIGKQITDLSALETRLRALLASGGSGGGRSGTGGGSPGNSGLNDYARQLKAIQGDLKSGAASTAQFEASTRAVKTAIDAEIASLRGLGVLTTDQSRRLDSLRSSAGQAEAALKGVATNATQQAAKAQSDAVSQLGRELSLANSKFQQGTLSTRDYLREMQRIQAAATALQPSLQAGSRDAQNLARTLQGIGGAGAKINATSITNVRTELARARTDYEKAISAAGSSWRKQQDAASQYQRVLAQVDAKITQIGRRPTVTPQQTQALANLQRQMASQQNALQGTVSPLGLSGSVLNALRQIPGLAQVAGGSLGAAAGQAGQLAGGLGGVAAAIGPIGIAIGVAVLALGSFISLASKSLSAFTDFEDAIQNAKGTLGLFGQEGRAAGEQLSKLAQSPTLTKLGFDSVQAAKAIEELGSRGLDTSEILGGGLETAAKLAAASGVKDLNVAAEALVGTMKAFGIEGEEARKIPDLLANAANVSALRLEDFRLAIAAGGSAARTAGFTVNEFTTTISLMRDRLISASDAGTSFKAFTAALTPNSKQAAAAMKQISFSAFDASGKMKSQRAIVEQLARGLRGMTDEQKQLTLETIFGSDGVRTATTLLDAYNGKTKDGTRLIDVRSAALNQQGTADKAAAERTNSLKQAQVELSNKVLILKERLGEKLAPAARAAAKGASALLDASDHLGEGLKKLMDYLIPAGVALLAFRANVIRTATITAWASLRTILTALPVLIRAVGLSLRTFVASNPIGLIATVAAGIAVYAKQIIDDTQSIYDAIDQNEQSSFDGLMKRVQALTKAGDELSKAKARFLLAQSSLSSAQAGNVTGTNFFTGERIIKIDPAEVKAAQQRLDAATKELKAAQLRATTRATGTVDTTTAASTAAAIKAATDAAGKAVISAVASDTGNQAADKIVDNCLKWVRLQLDKANPAAAAYINKMFQSGGEKFTDKNGKTSTVPTARTAANNLDAANLLRTFSSAKDLTVGDSVFYTSNGQNHTGIYLGKINGVDTVRGNNRVTSQQTGGARVVGDVPLSKLGTPDSYVKSSELFAAAGKPVGGPAVSAIKTANAELQKQIDIGKHLQAQLQAALAAGNDVWAAKIRGSIKVFKKENADAWAQISQNATTGGQTTGIALTKLKAALKGANPERLAELKLLYDQTKNTAAYNAVVTEQARRTREASASHNTAGIALTKLKAALKGASESRLADLKTEYDQAKNATAYSAVIAEQARRQRASTAETKAGEVASKKAAAQTARDAQVRANLVREIRQSIQSYQFLSDQHKVTGKTQLSFNQRIEDFRASAAKLPPELQKGVVGLLDQASTLSKSTNGQAQATKAVKLGGIALADYKTALKGAKDSRLAQLEAETRASKNDSAHAAVVAEQTSREADRASKRKVAAREQEAQSKKDAATLASQEKAAASLGRGLTNLIADFRLQAQQGKTSAESLQNFQQRLEGAGEQAKRLPPALRENVTALLTQGQVLVKTGQGVVNYKAQIETLKGEVDRYTLSELEAARAKALAAGDQSAIVKLLDKEIASRKTLSATQLDQADSESRLAQVSASSDGLEGEYQNRQALAKGNLATLYQLELQYGQKVQDARDARAREESANQDRQINDKYDKLGKLEGITDVQQRRLDADRTAELSANAQKLTNVLAANGTSRAASELSAKTALDSALLTVDRQTRDTIRKNNLSLLSAQTNDLEAQQQEALDVEGLTQQQILEVRRRFQPLLIDQKKKEVEASRAIEQQAETDRYNDAVDAATQSGTLNERRLQQDGSYLTVSEALSKEHVSNVAQIERSGADAVRDYTLNVKRATGKQLVAADKATSDELVAVAKGRIDDQLQGLSEMDGKQRDVARAALGFWRQVYAAMGEAGKASLAEVDDAIKKLGVAGDVARSKAKGVLADLPTPTAGTFARDLNAVGKTEDSGDARDSAEKQYDSLLSTYQGYLDKARVVFQQFADARDEDLTPADRQIRDGLLGTMQLYDDLISQITVAAAEAGGRAASAFTQAQNDKIAEGSLSLIEAQHALADQEGRDDGHAYRAGLGAALAYWKARKTGLTEGTPEYLAALQKITELETKVDAASAQIRLDKDQDSELALIEARYALAQVEGQDGGPAYLAGLQSSLAYWRGRIKELKEGTPEYLAALQKITDLEGKVRSQPDKNAEGALALSEAQYALAQVEGRDGGPAYLAGVNAALAYWKGRIEELTKGTPEYIAALQKIADLGSKIKSVPDANADGALALVEAEHALAELEKRDDGPAYQAGLNAALSYWRARKDNLTRGTPEYLAALQKVTDLETKLQATSAQAIADKDQESALALLEARHALAEQEGQSDGPEYLAGLRASLVYWKGRLEGLKAGTPEYTAALQKIADLGSKIKAADPGQAVAESLSSAAGLLKGGGKLQSGLAAGLDGFAAFFKAGGTAGKGGAILGGLSAFVGGLKDVFATGNEDVDNVTNAFVDGVQGTLGALAKGDWIGAIVAAVATVVNTVLNIIQGAKRSLAKAKQEISDSTKDVKFFDLGKYAVVETYRGGFLGLQTLSRSKIDQVAVDIAKTLGDAIYSGISNGILNGVKSGKTKFSMLGIDLKKDLSEQIIQGLIDGFLRGAVIKEAIQPFLDAYVNAMKSGDADALAAAAEGIQNAAVTANKQLQSFYENVIVPTSQKLGVFGSDNGPAGSLTAANAQLSELQSQYQIAKTQGERDQLKAKIDKLQAQIKAMPGEVADLSSGLSGSSEASFGGGGGQSGNVTVEGGTISAGQITVFTDALSAGAVQLVSAAQQQQAASTEFGGHVGRFGQFVTQFGQYVSRGSGTNWAGYNPQ